MNAATPVPDEDLRELLQDAVADVQPAYRLDEVLARISHRPDHRRWWYGGAAVLAASAASVAAVVALSSGPDQQAQPGPAGTPTAGTPSPEPSATPSATPATEERALAVYYVGDTPRGPRLYREFQRLTVAAGAPRALDGVAPAVLGPADDPDYRSGWPARTTVGEIAQGEDRVTIDIVSPDGASLRDRPAGMSAFEASLAIEQVVRTAQAGMSPLPVGVQLTLDGRRSDQILGVPTSEPLAAAPDIDVLALVSLSDPTEGAVLPDDGRLRLAGRANSFEATVPWRIEDATGAVVKEGFVTAEGMGDRLYPFADVIDCSDLAPGTYTLVVTTSDPSDGEGFGPDVDSRTFVVE